MRRSLFIGVLVVSAFTLMAKDKKPDIPSFVAHATNVMVTTFYGDNPTNLAIPREDREAMTAVESALRDWGRYHLVYDSRDADIIMMVRAGKRTAVASGPVGRPRPPLGGPQGGIQIGSATNAETGSTDDSITIYNASFGTESAPMWERKKSGGLQPPDLSLFKYFREQVEASDKAEAAKKH